MPLQLHETSENALEDWRTITSSRVLSTSLGSLARPRPVTISIS